jgi:uncharacterized protein
MKNDGRKFYIKNSSIEGQGVFAALDIAKGEVILELKGQKIEREIKNAKESKRYENWVGMGENLWLNVFYPYRYLNHSCEPSAAIVEDLKVITMRDIQKDEEITFDYSLTDHDKYWSMDCNCGKQTCRKIIHFVEKAPREVFAWHFPHIPTYFQKAYLKRYIEDSDTVASTNRDAHKDENRLGNSPAF